MGRGPNCRFPGWFVTNFTPHQESKVVVVPPSVSHLLSLAKALHGVDGSVGQSERSSHCSIPDLIRH